MAKATRALGLQLARADATFVRGATGFAIGGVSPIAQIASCSMVLDERLLQLDPIWAAAGSPRHVFKTSAEWLGRLTRAAFADIADR